MFTFRQFIIDDTHCGMKLGTDSVALGAWVNAKGCRRALDIGTGCGILALMLAQRNPTMIIDAVELDYEATLDCKQNFSHSPWSSRLHVHNCSFEKYIPETAPDLIISNPPYFTNGERAPEHSRASARHESALTVKALIDYAAITLCETGSLAVIIPTDRADECIFQSEIRGLKLRRQCLLSHKPGKSAIRTMLQLNRIDGPIEYGTLFIKQSDSLSAEFSTLTKDFYL